MRILRASVCLEERRSAARASKRSGNGNGTPLGSTSNITCSFPLHDLPDRPRVERDYTTSYPLGLFWVSSEEILSGPLTGKVCMPPGHSG